jgi:hypothetical protein
VNSYFLKTINTQGDDKGDNETFLPCNVKKNCRKPLKKEIEEDYHKMERSPMLLYW